MKRPIALTVIALASQFLHAAGYEKSIFWGGETAGIGGIATPQISGSQSVYFNPAGLATGGTDVSLNISPSQSQFKAPIVDDKTMMSSEKKLSFPAGLTGSYKVNEKLGLGIGYYVSGGAYSNFKGIVLGGGAIKGDFTAMSDLVIMELALAAGYKVSDDLSLGIAYRIIDAKAALSSIEKVSPTIYAQAELEGLKGQSFQGFKLGAQYKLGKTDLGFTYRSEAIVHAKGTLRTTVHTTAAVLPSTETGVTVGTMLPAAWTIGFKHACTPTLNMYGEYNFTEYSKVDNISVQTDAGKSSPIVLKNKDQHIVKIAAEYTGFRMPIRGGVLYGNQVTNDSYALPTGSPPGSSWSFTTGTGIAFGSVRVDGGLEYAFIRGTAAGKSVESDVTSYALHLGGTYTF